MFFMGKFVLEEKDRFDSPCKTVGGGEGDKCYYPTRLDPYGKGCYYDCIYCYAKSLLDFRGLWNPSKPSPVPFSKLYDIVKGLKSGTVVRLGGMTDCFQPRERVVRNTYKTIQLLKRKRIHYLIVTKSNLVSKKEYLNLMDPNLAHIQISIPSTSDDVLNLTDNAPSFSKRKQAVETLYGEGFDVSVRLSPFLPYNMDYEKLNGINCEKILVEFLRINNKTKKQLQSIVNTEYYTVKEGGYQHLTLLNKLNLLKRIHYPQISVCDDVTEHYNYFKENVNYNTKDCCNLKMEE